MADLGARRPIELEYPQGERRVTVAHDPAFARSAQQSRHRGRVARGVVQMIGRIVAMEVARMGLADRTLVMGMPMLGNLGGKLQVTL